MKSFTRRSVIKGALVCSRELPPSHKAPQATFPVDPRARIAVATYPFRAIDHRAREITTAIRRSPVWI